MEDVSKTQKKARLMNYRKWKPGFRRRAAKLWRLIHLQELQKYYSYRARNAKSQRVHEAFVRKSMQAFVELTVISHGDRRNEQKTRLRCKRAAIREMRHSYKGQS